MYNEIFDQYIVFHIQARWQIEEDHPDPVDPSSEESEQEANDDFPNLAEPDEEESEEEDSHDHPVGAKFLVLRLMV